jgi:hypothetical protein
MSPRDFDRQVGVYLDGEASRAQVLAIRRALRERPELKARLAALVRLHRAQTAALTRPAIPGLGLVLGQLRAMADRAGRCLAHACILVLVCVELDVALPRVDSQSWVNGGRPAPLALVSVAETLLPEPLASEAVFGMDDMTSEMPDGADMMPVDGGMMPSASGSMPGADADGSLDG